jgi:hypothetical protein
MTQPRIPLADPRVTLLAAARQQLAHNSLHLPTWDELTPTERSDSLPDARSYLMAAIRAGLVPAEVPSPAAEPLDLAPIEARVAAAEDGWHLVQDPDDPYRLEIHGGGPTHVAVFGGDPDDGSASYPTRENAEFAAHARADVPAMAAEIRRLRAVRDERTQHLVNIDAERERLMAEVTRLRAERDHWEAAASANGHLYSAAENQRDTARAELEQTRRKFEDACSQLLHFAAEAHRRKWEHDTGDEGPTPAAFSVLHTIGNEMSSALGALTTPAGTCGCVSSTHPGHYPGCPTRTAASQSS